MRTSEFGLSTLTTTSGVLPMRSSTDETTAIVSAPWGPFTRPTEC